MIKPKRNHEITWSVSTGLWVHVHFNVPIWFNLAHRGLHFISDLFPDSLPYTTRAVKLATTTI